ncbi:MAG: ribosome-associated translation inhibitor RaiA [Chloroflexota bacterium]|nr:ribosome-associated translation inhibitor RaiA [Chloroflexota bacterium]
MNLVLRAHHTSVHDSFREQAEKKLGRLDRYLPRIDDVVVEVAREDTKAAAHRYTVQVTVRAGDAILRAEERGADPRVALDEAVAVLSRQAQRHGKRLHDWHRRGAAAEAGEGHAAASQAPARETRDEDGTESIDEYIAGKVVRVKRFDAKPMSQEEALAQMDLLGHDFFLFLNARSNDYALLYKRNDGGYGLLEPERA